VGIAHRFGNRIVSPLGKTHIVSGIFYVRLIEDRIAEMGQYLVDASAGHDIPAEEKSDAMARL